MSNAAPETAAEATEAKPTKASAPRAGKPRPETAAADTSEPADETEPPVQRIVIEQAPAEPAVYYGEDTYAAPANSGGVKANYRPFDW